MKDTGHKFPYKWNLADGYPAKGIDYHGAKVFGTFICISKFTLLAFEATNNNNGRQP